MFSHAHIWAAIDELARQNDLSPSGLAIKANLDRTAFNKSKRKGRNGIPSWPSTETIAKILFATDTELRDFCYLLEKEQTKLKKN